LVEAFGEPAVDTKGIRNEKNSSCNPSFFNLNCFAQTSQFTGKVVAVTDGDTIGVLHAGASVKVRLHGIDCPESSQPVGARAKQATSQMRFGQIVTVHVQDIDRYGRTVGIVTLQDGRALNHELVRQGLAWWYRQYAGGDRQLEQLEAAARTAKAGLWSAPNPIPPWEFRKNKGAQSSSPYSVSKPSPAAPPVNPPPVTQQTPIPQILGAAAAQPANQVYVTNTGQKYHRASCRHVSQSCLPISIMDAKSRGYQPCGVCKP